MVFEHDFKRYPELTNSQMQFYYFDSPHQQITEGFEARVIRVIDGDTIRVSVPFRDFTFPVRMLDIDAPELGEGGRESAAWLREKISGKDVYIKISEKLRVGKWGRLLGKIFSDGIDVGQESMDLGFSTPFGQTEPGEIPNFTNELERAIA